MGKAKEEKRLACPLGPPDWVYKCGECGAKFTMPSPKGPSEERGRACPKCNSKNIKITNTVKAKACPPGG